MSWNEVGNNSTSYTDDNTVVNAFPDAGLPTGLLLALTITKEISNSQTTWTNASESSTSWSNANSVATTWS